MVLVFFVYFALASIAAGVLTVALKNPVHCGLALLALLLHVSGLFILLNAEFLWAVQVIVYAGAILVLYLFVLMLLNLKTDDRYFHSSYLYFLPPAAIGSLYVLALLLRSPFGGVKGDAPIVSVLQDGDTFAVGWSDQCGNRTTTPGRERGRESGSGRRLGVAQPAGRAPLGVGCRTPRGDVRVG